MHLGVNTQNIVDKLKRERDRFVAFAFASADILMEVDKQGIIKYLDGATMSLLDIAPEDLVDVSIHKLVHEDDQDLAHYLLGESAKPRIDNVALRLKSQSGAPTAFIMSGYRISELQGHYYLTFSTFRDNISMADISRRDLSTGLLRKGEFSLVVNKQLIMSKFSVKTPCLTMILVDKIAGVDIKQEALKKVFEDISDTVKSYSISGDAAGMISDNMMGLVHGEEVHASEIIEKILAYLSETAEIANSVKLSHVTIKLEADSEISEEDSAHAIVYILEKFAQTKGAAFDFESLSDGYDEMVGETIEKIAEFRDTVDGELFDLAFQPIVEIKTGAVSHFEVLTRLRDAKKFSNPFEFIEFGENVGMINDFDYRMVCRVIDVIKREREQGNEPHFAINISGYSLSNRLFLDKLQMLLTKNQDCCPQIMFEITESARVENIEQTNEYFKLLREIGIRCSIDDFGQGEATFEYLGKFEVDIVKIDGSYLAEDAAESAHGKRLLKALGGLCADMGVDVVGEKVETACDAEALRKAGIRYAQGYYYSKPETDPEILQLKSIKKDD